jgi:tetratricopeptide (TPR) repeat protein
MLRVAILVSLCCAFLCSCGGTKDTPALDFEKNNDLRSAVRAARIMGDQKELRRLCTSALAKAPGDGFILREYVLHWRSQGRLLELLESLESDDPTSALGIPLDSADAAFMQGLAYYYQERNTSALARFNTASELRLDWHWPGFYTARILENRHAPLRRYDALLRAASDDPDVRAAVLANRVYIDRISGDFDAARKRVDELGELPPEGWAACIRDVLRFVLADRTEISHESFAETIAALHRTYGVLLEDSANELAGHAARSLRPEHALAILEVEARRPNASQDWLVEQARLLWNLGYLDRARQLVVSIPSPGPNAQLLWLRMSEYVAPAVELEKRIDPLVREFPWESIVHIAERILADIGRDDEGLALRQRFEKENPGTVLLDRIWGLTLADLPRATALLDSLEQTGTNRERLVRHRRLVRQWSADVTVLKELEKSGSKRELVGALNTIASVTYDSVKSTELLQEAARLSPNDVSLLDDIRMTALSRNIMTLARDMNERLIGLCSDCPRVIQANIEYLAAASGTRRAVQELEQVAARTPTPPSLAIALANIASSFGRSGLADTLVLRAAISHPDWRFVQAAQADRLIEQRELVQAREIADRLAREFPGRDAYRQLQLAAGVTLADLAGGAARRGSAEFEPFMHDLTSTAWIQPRRDTPDTLEANARYLQSRDSYVILDAGGFLLRQRRVIEILSESAMEALGVQAVGFRPSSGTPRVLVARVVQPDGTVQDIPRDEMLVSGVPSEVTAVDDVRQLSVPFRNLRVGSVIDFVYELSYSTPFSTAWSFRHEFIDAFPVMESILEVKARQGIPIQLYEQRGPEGKEEWTEEPHRFLRWTLENVEPEPFLALEPDYYDRLHWIGFSSHASWNEVGAIYRELFWPQVRLSPGLRDEVVKLADDADSKAELVQRIFDYVVGNTRYVAIQLGTGAVVPTRSDHVLERGYGDCKDLSALTVAMLEEAGIHAEPVLVRPRPHALTRRDFVEITSFTHMIVRAEVDGDAFFSDPTQGAGCANAIDPALDGVYGLAVPREHEAELVQLPTTDASVHGYRMDLDLWPTPSDQIRVEVSATYRGYLANLLMGWIRASGAEGPTAAIDRALGYGLWEGCVRRSYDVEEVDCGRLRLAATFVDTTSARERRQSESFRLDSEVADPFIAYHAEEERVVPVRVHHAFSDTVVIRIHDAHDWAVAEKIAPISLRGDSYQGRISSSWVDSEEGRALEVVQTFELRDPEIAPEDYESFFLDWIRFRVGVLQPYTLKRALDPERLARLRDYAGAYPEDVGFALTAANEILGDDLGGSGDAGRERRDVTREFLTPILDHPDAGIRPLLFLALLEMEDGHFRLADSLLSVARHRSPEDTYVLYVLSAVKGDLAEWDELILLLEELMRKTGNIDVQLRLVRAFHAAGRADEARQAEDRYFALQSDADSTRILLARLAGQQASDLCEEETETMAALERLLEPDEMRYYLSYHLLACGDLEEARPLLEEVWGDNPFEPDHCNNLAWLYALLGTELERAEELSRAAILLSDDASPSKNTRATVLARQGEWEEARRLFVEARDSDDRPNQWGVNEYFIGLCDFELGRPDDAKVHFERALEVMRSKLWRERIQRSIELANSGGTPTDPIFVRPSSNSVPQSAQR